MTKEALASICEVSRRTIADWESGKVEAPRLDAIPSALGFPEDFFYGEDIPEIADDEVSFRAFTSMSARQCRSVLAFASTMSGFSAWIDDHYNTPALDIPLMEDLLPAEVMSEPDAVQCAYSLRRFWTLGARPVVDLMALLESQGIRIFSLPDGVKDVDAFSYWNDGRPTIFLNLEKSAERLRFDLAHELGHIVMHRGVTTRTSRRFEVAANVFASSFLVPSDGLLPQVTSRPSMQDLFTLKRYWRVSATAMTRRLHQLGALNDWQYRTWMVELSSRGFRSSEPDGIDREKSPLLKGVMDLARADGLRLTRLASELALPLRDLEQALAGLTLVPLTGDGAESGPSGRLMPRLRVVEG